MSDSWLLVQYKPNSHRLAVTNLERQGFDVFLPMTEVTKRQGARFLTRMTPLFPGYLFVAADVDTSGWRKINNTLGVSRIVTTRDTPSKAPDTLVQSLKSRCDATGKIVPNTNFAPGDNVEIVHGPLSEFVGTVEKIDPQQRVWILLEIMGQTSRVRLDPDHLSKD